ncbi:MAG TPA: ATP-dependent DNA helicase RecG [Pirellulales bacterium]|nr:ATP-dependent DNA helicase RecG [Pirellulales bacterium]
MNDISTTPRPAVDSRTANRAAGKSALEELATPVQFLKGVGPDRAKLLQRIGMRTAADVLFNFPRDYQDLSDVRRIDALEEDKLQSVRGTVEEIDLRNTGTGRFILGVLLRQDSQYLRALWFNMPFMADKLRQGQEVLVSGKPRLKGGRWEMAHPRVQWIDSDEGEKPGAQLLPVYSLTEGLKQSGLRYIVKQALEAYAGLLEEAFPQPYLAAHRLLPIQTAVHEIHFPASKENVQPARRRFIYQEMFVLQLAMALRRNVQETRRQAPLLETSAKIDARITRLFPFELTPGQRRAIDEIAADLARPTPMNRLLQGDVGCGKTVVAVYAMLLAVAHRCQAALMAPTEVLARQHLRTLQKMLANSQVRMALLSGSLTAKEREETLQKLATGEIDLIVGTQAIVYAEAQFKQLGLVVIDEQHRFGVRQRATLKQAGADPHYLVMTATPIPRTVAMTLYGDLDVSIISESPPGRLPVHTYLAEEENRAKWWDFFRRHLREGRQGYVIVPLVEVSEHVDTANLQATFEELAHGELEAFRLGLMHGRMSAEEKDAALGEFAAGRTQVLVATSVVEVGIDVPNATLMTILGADRFGLAQLHQMRGRVSRGKFQGNCCVFATERSDKDKTERSDKDTTERNATTTEPTDNTNERLQAFVSTTDGFRLAEIDFQQRGAGDLVGTRQHGLSPFRMADLVRDSVVAAEAREDARQVIAADPELSQTEHARLRQLVLSRYGAALDLGGVG